MLSKYQRKVNVEMIVTVLKCKIYNLQFFSKIQIVSALFLGIFIMHKSIIILRSNLSV